jgi:hypothetical protein
MYLMLYADAVLEIPRLEFDPNLLDEILCDFQIDRFNTLIALDKKVRRDLIAQIRSAIDVEAQREGDRTEESECIESEEFPDYLLLNRLLAV